MEDLHTLYAQRDRLRVVCQELFDLLEEHEPPWYLRRHYNRATAALAECAEAKKEPGMALPAAVAILPVPTGPIGAVTGDPHDPTHIYLGGSEGLYHSTDGGVTWTLLSRELRYPHVLLVDPSDSQQLYAARRDLTSFLPLPGIYRSVDGGVTWKPCTTGLGAERIFALTLDPGHAGVLYAGSWAGRVYKSVDGGETWFLATPAPIRGSPQEAAGTVGQLLVNPVDGALYALEAYAGTFRSTDGGASWCHVHADGGWLAIDPREGTLYLAGRRLQRSADGGQTWAEISAGLPYDPQRGGYATYWIGVHPDPLVLCTRYHRSRDGGVSWQPLEAPASFIPRALLPGKQLTLYGSLNGQAGCYQEVLGVATHA